MTRSAFPPHRATGPVVLTVLAAGLALAGVAKVVWWAIVPAVLCVGVGLGLAAMAALDRVRGSIPSQGFARHIHLLLRVPVLLLGVSALLLGPAFLTWGTWSAFGGQLAAGLTMALLGIPLTSQCTMFGLEAIRAAVRREQPSIAS